jgi:site-specific DNA-cytosine methylase
MIKKHYAYYNEIDPKACAWLRQLIKNGLIMDGEVDERSIIDVQASDIVGFCRQHFFSGIGGWDYALQLANWPQDKPVCTASLPCQPFSVAGAGKGKDDERHLLPHFIELVKQCNFPTIFGEQVPGAIKHGWLDDLCLEMARENYAVGSIVLSAAGAGAPHIRQRLYWCANKVEQRKFCIGESGGLRILKSMEMEATQERICLQNDSPREYLHAQGNIEPGERGRHDFRSQGQEQIEQYEEQSSSSKSIGEQPQQAIQQRRSLLTKGQNPMGGIPMDRQGISMVGEFFDEGYGDCCEDEFYGIEKLDNTRESKSTDRMADSQRKGSKEQPGIRRILSETARNDEGENLKRGSKLRGMVYADESGSQQGRESTEATRYGNTVESTSGNGRLGDSEHDGRITCQVATSDVQPSEEWRQEKQEFSGESSGTSRRNSTANISGCESRRTEWTDPDWLYCRDNKYRPIKPGIKPLSSGLPKGVVYSRDTSEPINADDTQEARVMRLKGYGNSIVTQVAAQFIQAYLSL